MLRKWTFLLLISVLLGGGLMPVQAQDTLLPAPSGPYQVGVTSLTLTDESREEIFTDESGDKKTVTVWIWYPADVPGGVSPSPYLMEGFDVEQSGFAGIEVGAYGGDPIAAQEWLSGLLRHAYPEVPVSADQETYPVVLYSDPTPISQSLQFEDLASHGYIVMNVVTVTGYVAEDKGEFIQVGDTRLSFWDEYYNLILSDLLFVVGQLESIHAGGSDSLLSGRLNLDQVGVVGHSIVGAVVMDAASQDDRIKAGITQDFESNTVPPQPFMYMRPTTCQRWDVTNPGYIVHIKGFRHGNYGDAAVWSRPPDSDQGRFGSIDSVHGMAVLNTYVVAFFDQYLKGEAQPLLQGVSADYPEVELQANDAAAAMAKSPLVITSPDGEAVWLDDFESGTLAGWTSACKGYGSWYVYTDGSTPPNPDQTDPIALFTVPNPPQGNFAAVTDMNGPGSLILYRDIQLDGSFMLHLTVFYVNNAPDFFTPNTLAWDQVNNQQYRIDLLDPSAPVDALAEGNVLATIFQTARRDPTSLEPTAVTFDLSSWAGQTVRLRLVNVNNQFALWTGVDDIYLEPIQE
jgi:predicted dienelactone hydrolase